MISTLLIIHLCTLQFEKKFLFKMYVHIRIIISDVTYYRQILMHKDTINLYLITFELKLYFIIEKQN